MTSRLTLYLIAAIAVVFAIPSVSEAAWNSSGSGNGYGKADLMAVGNTPTASVSNRSVTVNWTATGGSVPVAGYIVKRFSSGGAEQTVGANCSGIVTGTSCTETSVPPGTWRYTVTPARQNWRGGESGQSPAVTVNAPAMTLSPANVTSLPQTLTGQITNFVPGQTVTFRLDNQTTGDVLTGSITPSPVPANGTATVSVTLPSGVANGSHTIYAIGSGTDVASAAMTVAVCTAGSDTVIATADSWLDQASTAANHGTDATLRVRSGIGSNRRALVQFTLPTVPAGCSVTTATLRLNNQAPVLGRTIQALRVDASWTESGAGGVTWANQPATTGTAATATTPLLAGAMNWTVTAQVQAMYTAGSSYGFLLRDQNEGSLVSFEQQFDSKESGTSTLRPRLIVNWGP